MADYWRYADRMGPAQVPVKRMRGEFDDLAPAGAGYYSREEPRFDERDSRLGLREQEPLGVASPGYVFDLDLRAAKMQSRDLLFGADYKSNGKLQMGYGSGLTGADLSGLGGGHLGLSGLGTTNLGLPIHDDHSLLGQGGGRLLGLDSGLGKPSPLSMNSGRPDYLTRQDSQGPPRPRVPLPSDASSTLFVEGLPSDCSRREAAHVFRPFYGFKEVRLVRKEGKRSGSTLVLCFVDFTDSQHAATAREALQGYKFDELSQDSETLRLQFARTPGPRGGGRDDFFGGRDRDDFSLGGRPFRH